MVSGLASGKRRKGCRGRAGAPDPPEARRRRGLGAWHRPSAIFPRMLYLFALVVVFGGVAVALSFGIAWASTPEGKGRLGEFVVELELSRLPASYRAFHDVTLIHGDTTAQIDHVVVHTSGIFVIETKNYSGEIFPGSEKWIQRLEGREYPFHSPIVQNSKHVQVLAEFLNLSPAVFVPLVVFTTRCRFPGGLPDGVYMHDQVMEAIYADTGSRLNNAQTYRAAVLVGRHGVTTEDKRRQHLERLRAAGGAAGRVVGGRRWRSRHKTS